MIDLRASLESVPVNGLTAVRVRVPFRRPFATATGMWLHREAWILLLPARTAESAWERPSWSRTRPRSRRRSLRGWSARSPIARGRVTFPVSRSWSCSARRDGHSARRWTRPASTSGGVAIWEAAGAAVADSATDADSAASMDADPAVARTGRPGVPVNGTIGFGGPAAGAEAALQAIEAGFTTLKLKAGVERETLDLVARVRAIRTAVGPDIRLRLDVNGAWDLPTAEERLEAVGRFAIEYVEQPLAADDDAGAAELRRRVEIPLAADESAASIAAVRRLLAEGAADVLVVKPARVGGPVAVAEIASAAAVHGVPVVVSTLFETGIGISAALRASLGLPPVTGSRFAAPLAHGLATAGLLEHDLLEEPLIVERGWMHAPGGTGTGRLGVRVSRAAVARFAAEFVEATP